MTKAASAAIEGAHKLKDQVSEEAEDLTQKIGK